MTFDFYTIVFPFLDGGVSPAIPLMGVYFPIYTVRQCVHFNARNKC